MVKKSILQIELIPKTCWFSSVRTMVKPSEWDKIRHISYDSAGNKCEICSGTGKQQGYNHDLECHEIWRYDKEIKTQRLISLISLCPLCHSCIHYGRARTPKRRKECLIHFIKVNNWKVSDVELHIKEAYELYKERSKHKWILDISLLNNEPYSLKIDIDKKRVFKVNKWKKKRKKPRAKRKVNKRPNRYLK